MNQALVKSEGMTPIVEEIVRKWKCRHCKHRWPIDDPAAITNPELRPKQCPNRTCRAADWDRPKLKAGRPSTKNTSKEKRGPKPQKRRR